MLYSVSGDNICFYFTKGRKERTLKGKIIAFKGEIITLKESKSAGNGLQEMNINETCNINMKNKSKHLFKSNSVCSDFSMNFTPEDMFLFIKGICVNDKGNKDKGITVIQNCFLEDIYCIHLLHKR